MNINNKISLKNILDNRLLIIEDKELQLYTIATALLQAGLRIDTTHDINSALDLVTANNYKCAIIDSDIKGIDVVAFKQEIELINQKKGLSSGSLPLIIIIPKSSKNPYSFYDNCYTIMTPLTLEKLILPLSKIAQDIGHKFIASTAIIEDMSIGSNLTIKELNMIFK